MKIKTDKPTIPEYILDDINELRLLLDQAGDLREEIIEWYETELKSYDNAANPDDETYNPGTGITVEGVSSLAIMDSLSILQTANEVKIEKSHMSTR